MSYIPQTKVKSFTLSEMLVVMVITLIVVGIAFSVLSLVQKQISRIQGNFQKTTDLCLVEQRLHQEFNQHNRIVFAPNRLSLYSDIDTVQYAFEQNYTLRNTDTLAVILQVKSAYYQGKTVAAGVVDALKLSAEKELPEYFIFLTMEPDAAHFMN